MTSEAIQNVETPTVAAASVSEVKNLRRAFTEMNYTPERAALRAALAAILSWPRPEMPCVKVNLGNGSSSGAQVHQEGRND